MGHPREESTRSDCVRIGCPPRFRSGDETAADHREDFLLLACPRAVPLSGSMVAMCKRFTISQSLATAPPVRGVCSGVDLAIRARPTSRWRSATTTWSGCRMMTALPSESPRRNGENGSVFRSFFMSAGRIASILPALGTGIQTHRQESVGGRSAARTKLVGSR